MRKKYHNNQNPLVSVLIPSYNHADYIEAAIRSVWNQTYQNIELIVLDDGSEDSSPDLIRELEKMSPIPMSVIVKENAGLCATLNQGLEIARGKYVSILASDDKYLEDKTQIQVNFMEGNTNCVLCFGRVIHLKEGGELEDDPIRPLSGNMFEDLLFGNFIPAVSCLARKSVFSKVGGFDENSAIEDWDMWLRIAEFHEIQYVDHFLSYYRRHDNNFSSNLDKMELAKLGILNKWKGKKSFVKAKQIWALTYFCGLLDKKKGLGAFKLMLKHGKGFVFKKRFWFNSLRFVKRFLLKQ